MKKQLSFPLLGTNHKKRQRETQEEASYSFPFSSTSGTTLLRNTSSPSQGDFLSDLPDEILLSILEYLNIRQLSILAQVNKKFYLLTKDLPSLKQKFPYVSPDSPVSKKCKISPEPSLCHTAAVWGNKMWVHGGHNTIPNTQLFDDVKRNFHCYDLAKNTWRKIKSRNSPRKTEHSSLIYDDKLYMFGGYSGCEFTNSLFCYDFLKKKWKEISTSGDIPSARSAHVGGVYNDKMYIFGGWNGKVQNNDFFEFDFASSTWTRILPSENSPVPSARCSHASVVLPTQHKFFIFGGCGGNPVSYNNELWSFDFISKKWQLETSAIPVSPRSRMKMVEWNNFLYIYGGWNRKDHFSDLFEFNTIDAKWRRIQYSSPSPHIPSEQYSVVIHNNMLYIYGGFHSVSNTSCNQLTTIRLWFPEDSPISYPVQTAF